MRGTAKQVAWATNIKAQIMAELQAHRGTMGPSADFEKFDRAVALLDRIDDAGFWIAAAKSQTSAIRLSLEATRVGKGQRSHLLELLGYQGVDG